MLFLKLLVQKYGSLKDQFGIHWMFNYYEED